MVRALHTLALVAFLGTWCLGQPVEPPPEAATTQPTTAPSVAIPSATSALIQRQAGERFLSLIQSAGMTGAISGQNEITLFIPTDAAFDQVPAGVRTAIERGDVRVLRRLLAGHLAWGRWEFTRIGPTSSVRTVAGQVLFMNKNGSDWSFAGANVVFGDQPAAGQAVVHVIDRVLLPPLWDAESADEILTDAAIATSGPAGGLLHGPGCALGTGAVASAGAAQANVRNGAVKWEKPKPPTGPRGATDSIPVGDPTYDPNDLPPATTPATTPARLPVVTAPSAGGEAPTVLPAASCTCGLLPVGG